MRVLFADDQIPSLSDEENIRYREELRKELSDKITDFESKYQEDYKWFSELVRYLRTDMGFELRTTNSFSEAKELVQDYNGYDVAVIDLSWTGDPAVRKDKKKNAGLEILRLVSKINKERRVYKPLIAFSQNFLEDPELFSKVIETGAFPITKHYTHAGCRSLADAIKLMGGQAGYGKVPHELDWPKATVGQIIKTLTFAQLFVSIAISISVLAAVASFAYWLGLSNFGPLKTQPPAAVGERIPSVTK